MGGGLGFAIAAFDPFVGADDRAWAEAARHEALPGLLAVSDVVSLHVPFTDGTRNLIDAAALGAMPKGAVLINAARGGVVDEPALAAALKAGQIGGAALDVFAVEPLTAEAGAHFADTPNLILTPHIAGVTQEGNVRVSAVTVENVMRHLEGAR